MGPDMSYSTNHLWPYRRFNSKHKSYTGEGLQYVDCIGFWLVDDYFTYRAVAAYLIFPDSPACLGWYGCKKWIYTTWCLVQFGPRCPANHQIGAYWTVMREVMWLMLLKTWFGGNEDGEHQSPSWFRSVFLFVFHPHWCSPLSIGFMSAFWSSRQADTTSSSFPHIPSSPPWRFFSWQTSKASPPKAKPASPGPLSSQLGFLQTSIKLAVLIQPP